MIIHSGRVILVILTGVLVYAVLCLLSPVNLLNFICRKYKVPVQNWPSNFIVRKFVVLNMKMWGICTHVSADREVDKKISKGSVIFMYNHTSNLDPFVVQIACSQGVPRFVYKKELALLPIFGWFMWLYDNVSIDRKKRDKAVESLKAVAKKMQKNGYGVAISPEGTRSKTGELQPFKKGPFHLAHQCQVPIVPVIITGARDRWPSSSFVCNAGDVHVRLLEPIDMVENESVDELLVRVHRVFENALRK